ncbi:MAG: ornithine--acyl-ACP N-acyltransferase OlsB [Hyphomicrobium sp.]|nr:ornithine--acyl-ACP N-acyltransferase OlsB [Hyphomicrobium sp.]PPC82460.1 MAG: ornithine--acyl-ACP N-acyltransferase OlsB [Hyphomicrobium sp.]
MRHRARHMVSRFAASAISKAVPKGLLALRTLHAGVPYLRPALRKWPAKVYGRIGDLEVRLAASRQDVKRAQRLRYEVFYEEMSAQPSISAQMRRRDKDPYDAVCDHLLVIDTAKRSASAEGWSNPNRPNVVGTYRILRQDIAIRAGGFYSQGEYDLAPMLAAHKHQRFMELGRSCVLKPYRNKRSVELLWHGLWTYVREHKVDVMIGCASFEGTDPNEHAMALSFLHHHALAPPEWRCRAHDCLYVPTNRIAKDKIDTKAALKALPPLIKGYLRLGAFVGDGAVIDRQFGTTDVLIILPVAKIDPRYFGHFGAPDETKSRVAVDA